MSIVLVGMYPFLFDVAALEGKTLLLPSTQRRVIELTRLRELSNKEAAQVLELSEQTVKNQLSIGLKALRQELSRLAVPLWLLFFIN